MGCELRLLVLLGLSSTLWTSRCTGLTEGGLSGFGYDAASTCGKPYSRTGRARLSELPCDFSRENWCTIAGNTYPWHAVRRFVQENQGLMRRMYGDEKHFSVLKTELEKNDVELELENDYQHFYYDDASSLYRQSHFEVDYNEFDEPSSKDSEDAPESREHYARSLNSGSSGKLDKPKLEDTVVRRHSHPNETPTVSTVSYPSSSFASPIPSTVTTTTTANTSNNPGSTTSSPTSRLATKAKTTSSTASSASTTPLTSTGYRGSNVSATTTRSTSTAGSSTSSSTPTTPATTSTTTDWTPEPSVEQQIAQVQNLSANEVAGQIDRSDVDVAELEEMSELPDLDTTLPPLVDEAATVLPGGDSETVVVRSPEDTEASESQPQQQPFRPRPEYRPSETAKPETTQSAAVPANTAATASMEGQLYQDVAAKDKQEQPVLKVRGINACPVKEEVVAPFWANNTRGEVLALLNLYPFEQYVHWEKCTHENKQMYCRDGCRCEQQYRLHRLLAYDPNNECRGIFSDWFKFPSCCICRCYDLPLEFRVTSRSPRLTAQQRRRKLKVRAPRKPPRQRRTN